MKVLVADDEPDIRALIRFPLARRGVEVLEAVDGAEAVAVARRERPALALLDVMMPELDGLAACRLLREDPELSDIPIVILSARGQAADVEAGRAAGASAYLVKPFDTAELLALVARLTGADLSIPGRRGSP